MINHVRTLLMNRGPSGYGPNFPGEEYVVPKYRPRKLNLALQLAHRTLFGSDPDQLFMNVRIRQLMHLIHTSPLEAFVYAKDRRVTYWPPVDTGLFDNVFTTDIMSMGHAEQLYVNGSHAVNEGSGRCMAAWMITVLSSNSVSVTRQSPPESHQDVTLTFSDTLSSPFELLGSGLQARYYSSAPAGTSWFIRSRARPETDMGVVLARLEHGFGDEGVSAVFPPLAPEPVAVFRRVWDSHPISACRFAALLLAMAETIESFPQES